MKACKNSLLVVPRGVEVSPVGLKIAAKLSYEQWSEMVQRLQETHHSILWILGDAFVYGEDHFGQEFSQAIGEYAKQTLYNTMSVARRVEPYRRTVKLSWSHHAEVATLPPDEQTKFLGLAVEKKLKVLQLREAIRLSKAIQPDSHEEPQAPEVSVNSQEYVEHSQRPIDVQSISERAIEFLQRELEGASEEEVAKVVHAIVQAFMLPTAENLSEDWDEAAILRTKDASTLEKVQLVKTIFPGAKVRM